MPKTADDPNRRQLIKDAKYKNDYKGFGHCTSVPFTPLAYSVTPI
jgi:hypothetical protein